MDCSFTRTQKIQNHILESPPAISFLLQLKTQVENVGFAVNGTGTFKRVSSGNYGGYEIQPTDVVYRYDLGSTGCHYHGNDYNIPSGNTVTFSFDFYVSPSAGSLSSN